MTWFIFLFGRTLQVRCLTSLMPAARVAVNCFVASLSKSSTNKVPSPSQKTLAITLRQKSAPWIISPTCSSSYPRLHVIQSKCLRVIGNHPRCTPTSHLHNCLNIEPIPVPIHRLTDKFFAHCSLHPNPLVQHIGNYTLADLTNLYKKYKHKRRKHVLL